MPPALNNIDAEDVPPTHHVNTATSTTIQDQPDLQKESRERNTPEIPSVDPKPLKNTCDRNSSSPQKPSTPEDGDQGKLEASSGGTGGVQPASDLGHIKHQIPVSEWAGPHNQGSDNQEDDEDSDEFDDAPHAPRDNLRRDSRDSRSNSGHVEIRDATYAAAVARQNHLKRSGHTAGHSTRHTNVQFPGAYQDQDSEDNRQAQSSSSGYNIFGNITTTIQAAVMPTPQQKNQQLKEELYKVHGQLSDAKAHLDAYNRELKRTRGEMRQMTHHINSIEHERQRLREANQSYENELAIVRRELQDAKNLASIRGKELLGAQVFLTKADALSISEVVDKVNNLNEEIFQAAALLGEALIYKPHNVSQEEMHYSQETAQRMLGSKTIRILREQSSKEVPEANPLIVQVVLQIFLVVYCSELVHAWSPDKTYANYLAAVYSRIRDKEDQAVSGRWRSLTRSHTRPENETDSWKKDLLRNLGGVLRVAEWMSPSAEQRDAFQQKLDPIFRAVQDLRNALGEKFTSADLEVAVVPSDQAFKPAYMDDAYGDPNRKHTSQEIVVGTTGIGLNKIILQRSARGELMAESVLSAKVVLESTLFEALQPPPPRNSRKKKVTSKPVEEALPLPPKQVLGTGTPKPSSSASSAAAPHASMQAAAADLPQPPAVTPKVGQPSVNANPKQQPPVSPPKVGQPSVNANPKQQLPVSPPGLPPPEGKAGTVPGPEQPSQQREAQNLNKNAGEELQGSQEH